MSAAVDHAPAIAAGLVENRASLVPGFSLRAYVAEHWPAASEEELVRGARIALESIDGMLAEMDAGLDRVRPPEIRDCVADVKRELCRLVYAEDVPGMLWRLSRRWPVLTWPVFLEGVVEAMAHMEPGQDEDGAP